MFLSKIEDLVELDQLQLLFCDILAGLLGQVLAVPGLEFPVGGNAFEGRQLGGGTSIDHLWRLGRLKVKI